MSPKMKKNAEAEAASLYAVRLASVMVSSRPDSDVHNLDIKIQGHIDAVKILHEGLTAILVKPGAVFISSHTDAAGRRAVVIAEPLFKSTS